MGREKHDKKRGKGELHISVKRKSGVRKRRKGQKMKINGKKSRGGEK